MKQHKTKQPSSAATCIVQAAHGNGNTWKQMGI